jgi:hypothetical protein
MKKIALFALVLIATPASALFAQTLPQDPAVQRAQAQAQIDQTLQQTQLNNLSTQYSIQQNELRQQQQFGAMPPPAYQLPAYQLPANAPPRPLTPPPANSN